MKAHLILSISMLFIGLFLGNMIPEGILRHDLIHKFQLLLLSIGLYGAVYGINIDDLKIQKSHSLFIVTVGVLFKVFFIGGILFLITGSHLSWILGGIMAQIDPLSTAKLSESSKMSSQGKSFLNIWASFDDPMTVLVVFYLLVPLVFQGNLEIQNYFLILLMNIIFAGFVYILHKIKSQSLFQISLLGMSFIIAIYFEMMLGIGLIALFLRPKLSGYSKDFSQYVSYGVKGAFSLSVILLGVYLSQGIQNVAIGILLGCIVFVSQYVATLTFVKHLPKTDVQYLKYAQYNGITSIILATNLWIYNTTIISYVAIAIIVITLLYSFFSYLGERKKFTLQDA